MIVLEAYDRFDELGPNAAPARTLWIALEDDALVGETTAVDEVLDGVRLRWRASHDGKHISDRELADVLRAGRWSPGYTYTAIRAVDPPRPIPADWTPQAS